MASHDVGLRVRRARSLRKMNQTALAKLIGVKQPTLSELENGETKEVSARTLLMAARALNVRAEWLFFGEEPMEAAGDASLSAAELDLLAAYRAGTGRWRATVAHLLGVAPERQDEVADVILALVAKMAAAPVPDAKVKQAFGVAAKRSSAKA